MTEVQGTTTVFSENLAPLNDNGSRATATEMQLQIDGSLITSVYTWTYDDDGRLLSEGLSATGNSTASSATAAGEDYSDLYAYDLNGNRMKDTHTGPGNGATAVTVFAYNGDDQLTAQGPDANNDGVPDSATATVYTYDLNGSQTKITTAGTVKATYTYDVLNKMVGFSNSTTTASYVYDDAGNRVQETTGGTTTYFLTDNQNLTGYAQPLEERQTSVTSTPTKTYLIGDRTFGQASNTSSVSYLLIDGHGSTRQLTSYTASSGANGAVQAREDYDGFGNAITLSGVAANVASTVILYTGQMWDPGPLTYDLRYREYNPLTGRYSSMDDINLSPGDIANVNKYLYASGNPINMWDPSGHASLGEILTVVGISLNVLNFGFHVSSAISHYAHGQNNAGSVDTTWAMIDLLTLGLPFAGPGAGLATSAGSEAVSLYRAGLNTAAIWGYLSTVFSVANSSGGGGSSSSGGSSSGGSSSGPGQWENVNEGMPEDAARYQQQITGRSGQVYRLNGYKFDGFDGRSLIDAKDYYSWALKDGRWMDWFGDGRGEQYWVEMAEKQRQAAGNLPIVWHFAEKESADAVRGLVSKYGIDVVNTPRAF